MQLKNLASSDPTEPITLQEAKDYAHITSTTEDSLISKLITSARIKAENVLGRSLVIHSYMQEVNEHDGEIILLYPPIGTISKVEYFDGTSWNTLTSVTEYLEKGLNEKYIEVSVGYQNIRTTYATTPYVNEDIKRHIRQLVAIYYDNRPDSEEFEEIIVNKIAKYRIWQAL